MNKLWKIFNEDGVVTSENLSIINNKTKIFTMGSCFAVEINKDLKLRGYDMYPKYCKLEFDKSTATVGSLPSRENINYYHTFAILQEFQRSLGLVRYRPRYAWEIKDHIWKTKKTIYQDPYRRAIFAKTRKELSRINDDISKLMSEAIKTADIFIFTLGLIEVWRDKETGKVACMNPGYAGGGGLLETEFYLSNYIDNLANMNEVVKIINRENPSSKIIITTSPVPLGMTYTENDVVVANMESKSLLRTVCGEISRKNDNVIYFPSYEICLNTLDPYEKDGRHVKTSAVKSIVNTFLKSMVKEQ